MVICDTAICSAFPDLRVTDLGCGRFELAAPQKLTGFLTALAAFEALTNQGNEEILIALNHRNWRALAPQLLTRGAAYILDGDTLGIFPELLWQLPDLWLTQGTCSFRCARSTRTGIWSNFTPG